MRDRPPGTYFIGTYADIREGDWFMDPNDGDGYLYAAYAGEPENTMADPLVPIACSATDDLDASLITIRFHAQATAGIYRAHEPVA